MKTTPFLSALLAAVPSAVGQVSGAPFGFASGVTGGGNAEPVYPTTIEESVGSFHPPLYAHEDQD